nr:uncharacterized protein LOC109172840 isoform X5 [Ipomoea batatas]
MFIYYYSQSLVELVGDQLFGNSMVDKSEAAAAGEEEGLLPERGVYFQITYSSLLIDAQARRQMTSYWWIGH